MLGILDRDTSNSGLGGAFTSSWCSDRVESGDAGDSGIGCRIVVDEVVHGRVGWEGSECEWSIEGEVTGCRGIGTGSIMCRSVSSSRGSAVSACSMTSTSFRRLLPLVSLSPTSIPRPSILASRLRLSSCDPTQMEQTGSIGSDASSVVLTPFPSAPRPHTEHLSGSDAGKGWREALGSASAGRADSVGIAGGVGAI